MGQFADSRLVEHCGRMLWHDASEHIGAIAERVRKSWQTPPTSHPRITYACTWAGTRPLDAPSREQQLC